MHIHKIIILSIIIFISCTPRETEGDDLSKAGFYYTGEKIINELEKENAGYGQHFLLGQTYKKKGDLKKAIFHFANSCFKYSEKKDLKLYASTVYRYICGLHIKSGYYEDAVYEIASIFYSYREFDYIAKFVSRIPKSNLALYRDAQILKANAFMETERFDESIEILKELLAVYNDINSESLIYIRIASAYEQKKDFEKANEEYLKVLRLSTKTWQSAIAAERASVITAENKIEPALSDMLLIASSLYQNSKDGSIEILENLLKKDPDESVKPEILRHLVIAYIKSGKIADSEKLVLQYKDNPAYLKLIHSQASALWADRKRRQAFVLYQKLYKESQDDSVKKDSLKRMGQFTINEHIRGAENILTEYKDKYPADKASGYFLWILARLKLKAKDNSGAIKYMEESLLSFPKGAYSARNRYWLSRLYAEAGKKEDSENKTRELILTNPNSPYAWKKLDELKNQYTAEEAKNRFSEAVSQQNRENALYYHAMLFMTDKNHTEKNSRITSMEFIDTVRNFNIFESGINNFDTGEKYKNNLKEIEKYFAIGYYDGIIRELSIIPDNREFRLDKYKTLAYLGGKYNNYFFAATSVLKLMKYSHLKENITIFPDNLAARLYPEAFGERVASAAAENGVAKEMIYALMKAESSFNNKAVSSAGAVGLMQLMPATAKQLAKEMKITDFDLKDPDISISFGARYIAWLNKYFKQNFEDITAGYNAGAGNVKKWKKEYNSDTDYYIEFIPFQETRDYVLRTNKFYIQYLAIYK